MLPLAPHIVFPTPKIILHEAGRKGTPALCLRQQRSSAQKLWKWKKIIKRLSPLDVFFDRAPDDKAVDRRRPRLPAPVHAVDRLGFHRRVEERLQEKDVVGFDLTTRRLKGATCRKVDNVG